MNLHLFETRWEPAPHLAPRGTTLLAVGDIHGHAAHLDAMLAALDAPMAAARVCGGRTELVMLGDYVDRGPSSLAVLDRLLRLGREWRADSGLHLLRGNHDRLLIDLLYAPGDEAAEAALARWCRKGGDTVLRELGLSAAEVLARSAGEIAVVVSEGLGAERRALLASLRYAWRCGDWLFVHGGVDPGRPVGAQDRAAWLELREPFLSGPGWRHGFAVVHGHSIRGPEVLAHRVAVDSGTYRTGVLSAVEITGARLRFLCVADRSDLTEFLALPGPCQGRTFTPVEGRLVTVA